MDNRQGPASVTERKPHRHHGWRFDRAAPAFLKAHPICAVKGCGRRARHVDHKLGVRVAPHLLMDKSNWQALCHRCHSAITRAYESNSIRGACDEDGNPLDPGHPWAQADNRAATAVVNLRPVPPPRLAARLKADYVAGRRR